jgi:hypothetical protein
MRTVTMEMLRAGAATPHQQAPLSDYELHEAMRSLRESQRRR